MFDHPNFRKFAFEEIPLDRDLFLMSEEWLKEYENTWVRFFENRTQFDPVGYIGYIAARSITEHAVELSWYPNVSTRFHEVRIWLPRSEFITCVGCYDYDEKPHVFVRHEWIDNLYSRTFSLFAMVDAVGVKEALGKGTLTRDRLLALRNALDDLAQEYSDVAFISFADSLLIKSHWLSGNYLRKLKYTYNPEKILDVIVKVREIFKKTVGLDVYAIVCQGSNEYYDDSLLHFSKPNPNHISMNSLGLPFNQLSEIDRAARNAIRRAQHREASLYMDEDFYHSLNFKLEYAKQKHDCEKNTYHRNMATGDGIYFISELDVIIANLESEKID